MTAEALRELQRFAQSHLPGRLYTGKQERARYATDMSMYRILPQAVYRIVGEDDLSAIVRFAAEHAIELIPRSGGSNTGGTAIGRGLVLLFDHAEELAAISGPAHEQGEVRVTAGAAVRHDQLQQRLAEHHRRLPSDPSSGPLSYLGGNVATKASGPHALRHGAIDRYIRRLRYVSASGRCVDTGALPAAEHNAVRQLKQELLSLPAARRFLESRRNMKSASGYNVSALLYEEEPGTAVAKLFAGSLGTLGFITEVTLATEPSENQRSGLLLYFRSLPDAARYASESLQYGPSAVEILNGACLELVRRRHPDLEVPSGAESMLVFEFEGADREEAVETTRRYAGESIRTIGAYSNEELESLWLLRKRLLFELRHFREGFHALSLVNDIGVPVPVLADFIRDAEALFDRHNIVAPIYGHAGDGNLHLRPLFELSRPDLKPLLGQIADEVYALVISYGGTITGEHGVGRQRARYLSRELPDELYGFLRSVKRCFDPQGICNPDAMFESQELTENLNL